MPEQSTQQKTTLSSFVPLALFGIAIFWLGKTIMNPPERRIRYTFSGLGSPTDIHVKLFAQNFDESLEKLRNLNNKTCKASYNDLLDMLISVAVTGSNLAYAHTSGEIDKETIDNWAGGFNNLNSYANMAADAWIGQCKARGMYRHPFQVSKLPVLHRLAPAGKGISG